MEERTYDLVVLGGGPGGYVAAIRAAQLGLRTVCVDENAALGGTCLRVGCIPSKALLESSHHVEQLSGTGLGEHGIRVQGLEVDLRAMMARKDKVVSQLTAGIAHLFKKNKVEWCRGRGRLVRPDAVEVLSPSGETTRLTGRYVLIATGSVPASIPGVEFDGPAGRVGTSTEGLAYTEVPKHLVVIGAGYIGLELGSVWRRLGSKVTLLEYSPVLLPMVDREVSKLAARLFAKQGLEIQLGVKVTGARAEGEGARVTYENQGVANEITCDRVLVSTGRRPHTQGIGLEVLGIQLDERGFIAIDEHFETTVKGVYAIGDVVRGPMLAHKAEEEGVAAVEGMAGQPGHVNYAAIPGIVYTQPEIASVGANEQELEAKGIAFKKGSFPFVANGRAKGMGETEGFVKILADAATDRILGVHCIGARAGDLIAEAAVAMEFSASAEDLARSVHAHPTLAEAVKEAALAVDGRAIHV